VPKVVCEVKRQLVKGDKVIVIQEKASQRLSPAKTVIANASRKS